jgi:hypothetical protein
MTATDLEQLVSWRVSSGPRSRRWYSARVLERPANPGASQQASSGRVVWLGERLSPSENPSWPPCWRPDREVTTVNAAMVDNAPVSYCCRQGILTVLAPDSQYQIVSIFDPLGPEGIAAFAAKTCSMALC